MDNNNWKTCLPKDARQRFVEGIKQKLEKLGPPTVQHSGEDLMKVASCLEEKILHDATDADDYITRLSRKILSLGLKAQSKAMEARVGSDQGVVRSTEPGTLLLPQIQANDFGYEAQLPRQVAPVFHEQEVVTTMSLSEIMVAISSQRSEELSSRARDVLLRQMQEAQQKKAEARMKEAQIAEHKSKLSLLSASGVSKAEVLKAKQQGAQVHLTQEQQKVHLTQEQQQMRLQNQLERRFHQQYQLNQIRQQAPTTVSSHNLQPPTPPSSISKEVPSQNDNQNCTTRQEGDTQSSCPDLRVAKALVDVHERMIIKARSPQSSISEQSPSQHNDHSCVTPPEGIMQASSCGMSLIGKAIVNPRELLISKARPIQSSVSQQSASQHDNENCITPPEGGMEVSFRGVPLIAKTFVGPREYLTVKAFSPGNSNFQQFPLQHDCQSGTTPPECCSQAASPETSLEDETLVDPLQRLIKKIDSMSTKALSSALGDMKAIISCNETCGASAPGTGSRYAVGEDLALSTKARLRTRGCASQENIAPSEKRLRQVESFPLSLVSADGSVQNVLHRLDNDFGILETGMTSSILEKSKFKVPVGLRYEIRQANDGLIDSVVEVSEDGTLDAAAQGKEGIVVICSYKGIAARPSLSHSLSRNKMLLLPRVSLLIPPNYPETSPSLWPDPLVPNFSFAFASVAREAFLLEMRCLAPPVALKAIAVLWDICARNALAAEAACHYAGRTFSSKLGVWQ